MVLCYKHFLTFGFVYEIVTICGSTILGGFDLRKKRIHRSRYVAKADQRYVNNGTILFKENGSIQLICREGQSYGCWTVILALLCLVLVLYCCCWQISRRCKRDPRRLGNSIEDCF